MSDSSTNFEGRVRNRKEYDHMYKHLVAFMGCSLSFPIHGTPYPN
jgi:hypothetical protein